MTYSYTAYILPLIAAAVIAGGIAIYTWRRRAISGARPLALLALAICAWLVFYALELAGAAFSTKLFWGRLQYLPIAATPLFMLLFALSYTRRTAWINLKGHLLFATIPAITAGLVLAGDYNDWVWRSVTVFSEGDFHALDVVYGPWFWVHTTYSYLVLIAATLILWHQVRRGQTVYRRQAAVMLAGVLIPWIGNAIYLARLSPVSHMDLTPFSFTITVSALTWAIFGFRLIDLAPIARDLVVEDLPDGMFVLDAGNRIVDVNPAAARMLGQTAKHLVGRSITTPLAGWPGLLAKMEGPPGGVEEISTGENGDQRWYDLRISPLYDRRNQFIGKAIIVRDITARKKAEARLSQLSRAVEASPASIVITALDGNIEYVNPKFVQTTGYTLEDVHGQNPRLLKTDFTPAYIHRQLWETITAGREWRGEFCNRKKNGELFWEQASISPILGDDGNPASFVAVKEDITEQRRLREQLRQQNAYLSFMHQIMLELLDRREIDDLLQGIVDGAAALLDAPFGQLMLREANVLVMRAYTANAPFLAGLQIERGEAPSLSWQAVESGAPAVVEDYTALEGRLPAYEPLHLLATAIFPVMVGKRCLGVLGVGRTTSERPFTAEEVQTGQLFTRLAALTLDNAELYDSAIKEIGEHKRTQARLQASETRYRQIVENASDTIFLTDVHLRFTYVNPTALRMLGVPEQEALLQRTFTEIVAPGWRERLEEFYARQLRSLEPATYLEFPALRADGQEVWVGQNVQLIEDRGEVVGFQGVARDITLAKLAQQVLELARDQAVEASHFKSQLVARVSHELRTPLGAVIGFTELLEAGAYGALNDVQRQTVTKIHVSSEYLTSMINDLLDGAQLEARRLTLRLDRCAPRAILEHVEARMAVLAANKGLALHTSVAPEMPRKIIADRQRLEQILTNLVGNAIKYSDKGEVCVHIFPSSDERWGMVVTDTGIGISPDDLAHIFEPFYQVQLGDGQNRRGTGLGLSITRQLVDLMGGKISVESKLGRGSAFTVLLPMERVVSETAGLG